MDEEKDLLSSDNIESPDSTDVTAEKIENTEELEVFEFSPEESLSEDSPVEEPVPTPERVSLFDKIKRKYRAASNAVKKIPYPYIIIRLLGCYFLAMACYLYINREEIETGQHDPIEYWQNFVNDMSFKPIIICFLAGFIVLTVLRIILKKVYASRIEFDGLVLTVGIAAMSFQALWKANNFYYALAFIIVCAIAVWFAHQYGAFRVFEKLPRPVIYIVVFALMCLIGSFIAVFTIYRYECYGASTFDFGIFVQMFHSMATTLKPVTTCERQRLLSHFAIHFSPIFYTLLPFYYFFKSPETLLVAQAVLVATGVIPLVGICRKHNFSNLAILGFSMSYLFCVELVSPCFYDFHENAFLPCLLMWFFYAVEKRKYVLMYIMLVLLLCVKEDVSVYMMLIGAFCIFRLEKKRHGIIVVGSSLIWFTVVTKFMEKYGEGVMTSSRYGNFMTDYEGSFGNIIKTVICDPIYFITQCIDESDFNDLQLLLMVMVPLAFLPFVTKKFSRYFLIAPFLLMNLAPGYAYANQYGYQYVFGTTTCLIYCSVINYADLKKKGRRVEFLPPAIGISTMLLFSSMCGGEVHYKDTYKINEARITTRNELIDSIPYEASVSGDSFDLSHCSEKDEVYIFEGETNESTFTDFVMIRNESQDDVYTDRLRQLSERGYVYYNGAETILDIYVSPEYLEEHPELELKVKDY